MLNIVLAPHQDHPMSIMEWYTAQVRANELFYLIYPKGSWMMCDPHIGMEQALLDKL